jgi:hypothetical protein
MIRVDSSGGSPANTLAGVRARPSANRLPSLAGVLRLAAWALGALAAFEVYLRLARTRATNSDGASQALQAWDMLHGNPLLRGWRLSDVSFYTTELPQYALVELIHGLNQDVVHVAAAMTYTLVVLSAALIAKGTATGREAAVRVALAVGILLAPQPVSGVNILLSSPDHIGTSVPVMAVWLILDRARPRWYVPVIASLLLALAQAGDMLVVIIGVVPLVLVCAVRVLRPVPGRWYEIALAVGAIAAGLAGEAVPRLIHAAGGYTVRPLGAPFAPLAAIAGHNLAITGQSLLLLPGADFLGLRMGASTLFVMLHLAGVALAACGIAVAAWRFMKDDLVSQLLLAGIAANLLAFAVGTHVFNLPSAREIAPVLPLAAALAGRELARPLLSARPAPPARLAALPMMLSGLILAGYLAGLALSVTQPIAPPQAQQLTTWLEHHHLGTGLSGYWEANVVALTSGDRVAVRLVGDDCACGLITVGSSQVKEVWFDPARSSADFLVLFPGIDGFPGFTGREQALATFGKPARTYHVGRYTILYWHKNLLARLRP